MPEISVIIPVYNQAGKIAACLDSLMRQTFTDYEIIVVNDGSTDNLSQVLLPWQEKIKFIEQKNSGAASARNAGSKLAQGEFLLFCDADLQLKLGMLEKMRQVLKDEPAAAYVYANYYFGWKLFKGWPYDAEKLKKINFAHTSSLLRAKDFLGFDESLKRFQDWDLWLALDRAGKKGVWLDEVLFKVRTGGTISTWLPSWMYKIPWLKSVRKYQAAKEIIEQKYNI